MAGEVTFRAATSTADTGSSEIKTGPEQAESYRSPDDIDSCPQYLILIMSVLI
mgnify:FL=1